MRYAILLLLLASAVQAVDHVPGEIIVKYKGSKDYGAKSVSASADISPSVLKYEGKDTDELLEIIEELNRRPDVEYAQLNYLYKPLVMPNDFWIEDQWHINSSTNSGSAWGIERGSNETVIAIIDRHRHQPS